ncbi:MAG TPA: CoB--CoM heterodisulfide reductase iron-sulfur subunit B family protein [Spirochaetia bacterium]|nr:CoB--CoM heterodisulfide reductase iron-sulfur subunit B family protein [Spirochaetia bacterium]
MKVAYYPGCSLESSAVEYDLSSRAVCQAVGLDLVELPDWSCCGASSAHGTSHLLSLALPARNLKLAQEAGLDIVAPCSACYNRLKFADYTLRHDREEREKIEEAAGFSFTGESAVLSLLEAVVTKAGLPKVKAAVTKPLAGLKLVSYYGCLLVRPLEVCSFDDPENPVSMDKLMATLGADVLDWSYKTDCCGAALTMSRAGTVTDLVGNLLERAAETGAEAVVTSCPVCQANLETRRRESGGPPVFFFTELMGLAFQLPGSQDWLRKHLVDPLPLLHKLALAG